MLNVMVTESKRPEFRDDYRYEKAFGAFYKLHPEAVNWYQSRIRCEAEGTELFVPANLDEADSIPLLIAPILTKYEGVYVGMHDLYSERTFITIKAMVLNGGALSQKATTEVSYYIKGLSQQDILPVVTIPTRPTGNSLQDTILELLWELKQPLHSGGRCVAMRRNGKLFVHPCSNTLPFACKIKASNVVYYPDCDTFDSRWKLGPNSTCYQAHIELQKWHVAHSTCYLAGGHLAILDTKEEAEYIREVFKQVDQHKTPGDFAFLGFSDLFQRYHYRTLFGERLPQMEINWDFKCPGNFTKLEDRCGGIRRSGLLATENCGIPSMFFCEKPSTGAFKHKKALRHDPNGYRTKHLNTIVKLKGTMLEEYT